MKDTRKANYIGSRGAISCQSIRLSLRPLKTAFPITFIETFRHQHWSAYPQGSLAAAVLASLQPLLAVEAPGFLLVHLPAVTPDVGPVSLTGQWIFGSVMDLEFLLNCVAQSLLKVPARARPSLH
ncbi:hypothetical protein A8B78_10100 [Jannaschia sp. EhC01]|nr:hypothetical protein A8B78_10100 [Jannaschia sp. EhC01]